MAIKVSAASKALIQASIPAVAGAGDSLTKAFYSRTQPRALFNSIVYAAKSALSDGEVKIPAGVLACICHKHASLAVPPDAYAIVGAELLGTIKEQLNAPQDVLDAWGELYGIVAGAMTGYEKGLYDASIANGGWVGKKKFVIKAKEAVSESISVFHFAPQDGSRIPTFLPGQYISIFATKEQLGIEFDQPRQYSLISKPSDSDFAVAVKHEQSGLVSSWLHNKASIGDVVDLTAPFGAVVVPSSQRVVFLSAGSGISANLGVLRNLLWSAGPQREIIWAYGTTHGGNHPFRAELIQNAIDFPLFKRFVFYSEPRAEDKEGLHYHAKGNVDAGNAALMGTVPHPDDGSTDFLLSGGPQALRPIYDTLQKVWKVPAERIHIELFGSGLNLAEPK